MKTHEDIEAYLEDLFEESDWAENDTYPVEDWKYEVRNDDTRLGYRPWLYYRIASEGDDE